MIAYSVVAKHIKLFKGTSSSSEILMISLSISFILSPQKIITSVSTRFKCFGAEFYLMELNPIR